MFPSLELQKPELLATTWPGGDGNKHRCQKAHRCKYPCSVSQA